MMETVEEFKKIPVGERFSITTPVSTSYRKQWGEWEAIREIVQNTLDEVESLPELTKLDDATICIQDHGEGCELANMIIFGKSEKKGENKRGQYGEGAKMAATVLLRCGFKVTAESRDWKITFTLGSLLGEEVLKYDIEKTYQRPTGFKFLITGIDYNIVKGWFNERFIDPTDENILHEHCDYGKLLGGKYIGKMYCKNIYVCDAEKKSVWGYDLYRVNTGTDRNFMNSWDRDNNVGGLLSTVQDDKIIEEIITSQQIDILESRASGWELTNKYLEAMNRMFGYGVVVDTDADKRGKVSYNNGKLVVFKNSYFVRALQRIGFKDANTFISIRAMAKKEQSKKYFNELGEDKQRIVKRGINLVRLIKDEDGKMMFPISCISLIETNKLMFYDRKDNTLGYVNGDKVYIAIEQCRDIVPFALTLIEELIHDIYRVDDVSEVFEERLKDAINGLVQIAVNYISPKTLDYEGDE